MHCHKSIAWYDQQRSTYKRALRFKGTEEQEFAYSPNASKFSPNILKDECAYESASWKQTVLEFTTKKFIRLPITDIAPLYTNVQDSMFGVELGPVCFV